MSAPLTWATGLSSWGRVNTTCQVTVPAPGVLDRPRPAGVREPGYGVEVALLDVVGEAASGHIIDHALTKWRHGTSPLLV